MSSVTDRPKDAGNGPFEALTIAVTVEKWATDGVEPWTQAEIDAFRQRFAALCHGFAGAGFYGVYGGDVPRHWDKAALPEAYVPTPDVQG